MKNIENVIKSYLSRSTDYAVQIEGNWGVGKTYFYRNTLIDLIKKTVLPNNSEKTYKPVYISLFGLKSIEEISTKLIFEFYQNKFFNKQLTISSTLVKLCFRGILNFSKLGNINDYIADVKQIGEKALDTDEIFICFDDLERKDSSLKIEDFIGYVNSLVDENIKVLIISNDDKLVQQESTYKDLKEKVIGVTISYNPNVETVLQQLIKIRFSSYKEFSIFILEQLEVLVTVTKACSCNYRNIKYALDCLHDCYSQLRVNFIDNDSEIANKLQEELPNITLILLALAVDYKNSTIKYKDSNQFHTDNLVYYNMVDNYFNDNNDDEKKGSVIEAFLKKYGIKRTKYSYYESIFKFITKVEEFDTNLFFNEFKSIFNLSNGTVEEHYQIFDSLSNRFIYNLSDDEYTKKINSLVNFAEKGLFKPVEYFSVFELANRYSVDFGIDTKDLFERVSAGIVKSINNRSDSGLQDNLNAFQIMSRDFIKSQESINLKDIAIREYNSLITLERENILKDILNLFQGDLQTFEQKYLSEDSFKRNVNKSDFLRHLEPKEFATKILSMEISSIYFLETLWNQLFLDNSVSSAGINNLEAISHSLNQLLTGDSSKVQSILRKIFIENFISRINELLGKYKH